MSAMYIVIVRHCWIMSGCEITFDKTKKDRLGTLHESCFVVYEVLIRCCMILVLSLDN